LIENFDDKLLDLASEILTFKQSYIVEKIYKKQLEDGEAPKKLKHGIQFMIFQDKIITIHENFRLILLTNDTDFKIS